MSDSIVVPSSSPSGDNDTITINVTGEEIPWGRENPELVEVSTMVTDYLMAIFLLWYARNLYHAYHELKNNKKKKGSAQRAPLYHMWASFFHALGAVLGGTHHGFAQFMDAAGYRHSWIATEWAIGLTSAFLTVASIMACIPSSSLRKVMLLIVTLKFQAFAVFCLYEDDFMYVIIDYLIAILVIVILELVNFLRTSNTDGLLVILGLFVNILASGLQQGKVHIHPQYCNHNDLYHFLVILAMYICHRGGQRRTTVDNASPGAGKRSSASRRKKDE